MAIRLSRSGPLVDQRHTERLDVLRPGRATLLALALALTGCVYDSARIGYRDHPDLLHAKLATGGKPPATTLGPVEGEFTEWGDCDDLARKALAQILDDARAMGGTDVADVKFRQRFNWAGRPVCRKNLLLFGRKSIQVRGFAVKEPTPDTKP